MYFEIYFKKLVLEKQKIKTIQHVGYSGKREGSNNRTESKYKPYISPHFT
jgi:hypothetical protein